MIEIGDAFPTFSLPDQSGNVVTSDSLKGGRAVIYFYPKDDTSGCTLEACDFRDRMESLTGVRVVGVSPDSVKSHQKFATKYNLNFSLVSDEERVLIEACGLWVEKSMYGKKYMGVERTTFIVDANGIVTHAFRKVKPEGHADAVRAALAE